MQALPHSVPPPCSRPLLTHTSTGDFWTLTGKVWVNLLWGHCSFLLGPGAQGSICALQESVSPGLCKFWRLYGGVNSDLLQKGLCHTQVRCTPKPLPLWQSTADPYLCRRHSNTVLSQSLWSLWVLVHTKFEPSEHL